MDSHTVVSLPNAKLSLPGYVAGTRLELTLNPTNYRSNVLQAQLRSRTGKLLVFVHADPDKSFISASPNWLFVGDACFDLTPKAAIKAKQFFLDNGLRILGADVVAA